MNNDIDENFLLFGTAKDIWDAAKETYSSSENTSELFQAIYVENDIELSWPIGQVPTVMETR